MRQRTCSFLRIFSTRICYAGVLFFTAYIAGARPGNWIYGDCWESADDIFELLAIASTCHECGHLKSFLNQIKFLWCLARSSYMCTSSHILITQFFFTISNSRNFLFSFLPSNSNRQQAHKCICADCEDVKIMESDIRHRKNSQMLCNTKKNIFA